MGIGNSFTLPRPAYAPSLITPHGDRKLDNGGVVATEPFCSLPLMGIGNYLAYGSNMPCLNLITPHGDRKRPSMANDLSSVVSSLPLMGIGNLAGQLEDHA